MLWELLLDLEMVSEFHIWYENHALKEQKILNSALKSIQIMKLDTSLKQTLVTFIWLDEIRDNFNGAD